jgi:hypothetical protein
MPDYNSPSGAGKSFMSTILDKLPFVAGMASVDEGNDKYNLFERLAKRREERVMGQSVLIGNDLRKQDRNNSIGGHFGSDRSYHEFIYASIDEDKIRRLSEYRRMAGYAEVGDALDEICDEFVVKDENNRATNIKFSGIKPLEPEIRTEIEKEFQKYVQNFDFEHRGWSYCRQFLVEGELFFENIISEKKPELGIIGNLAIPGELINPVYDNIQNEVIRNYIFQKPISIHDKNNQNSPRSAQSNQVNSLQRQLIALEGNQVTYIHSGIWNEDKTIRVPFLENARRSYRQLSLIEDSIVIYRMVRAPERLKFTIDVGNMPAPQAESYVKRLMQNYWSKKSFDTTSSGAGGAANLYNPQSMLDSYWFPRRTGETGSDVSVLPGAANLDQLADLNYFVTKLYKSLKVPTSRLTPGDAFKDGSEILREELHFARTVIRFQEAFAKGVKQSFVAHLKLRKLWSEYKLKETDFSLEFNVPTNFMAIRQQQLMELKLKNFADLAGQPSIAPTFAQKHYLGYSDAKISENMEWRRKDAALTWELTQIESSGPNWREHVEAAEEVAAQMADGAPPSSGMSSSTGATAAGIPDFGGGTPPAEAAPGTPATPGAPAVAPATGAPASPAPATPAVP